MTIEEQEKFMRAAAEAACACVPKGWGTILIFAPIATDIVNGGEFISDIERGAAIQIIRQTADRLEKKLPMTN